MITTSMTKSIAFVGQSMIFDFHTPRRYASAAEHCDDGHQRGDVGQCEDTDAAGSL